MRHQLKLFLLDVKIEQLQETNMGVHRGGQGGLLPPPGRPKIVCFQTFLGKLASLWLFFRQKVGSCPPLENFCPTLEKSLRTPMETNNNHFFSFSFLQLKNCLSKQSQYFLGPIVIIQTGDFNTRTQIYITLGFLKLI